MVTTKKRGNENIRNPQNYTSKQMQRKRNHGDRTTRK